MEPISDQALLEMIRDPDRQEAGFRLLLLHYQETLYFVIRRIVIWHDDTDDVFQNTMIKIFKNIDSFEHRSSLSTWMYKIATNESLVYLRKNKNQTSTLTQETNLTETLRADPFFDGDELQISLQQAISNLPERQKLVFTLRYYEEMPYNKISDILNTSEGSLKASYHHAVRKIQQELNKNISTN